MHWLTLKARAINCFRGTSMLELLLACLPPIGYYATGTHRRRHKPLMLALKQKRSHQMAFFVYCPWWCCQGTAMAANSHYQRAVARWRPAIRVPWAGTHARMWCWLWIKASLSLRCQAKLTSLSQANTKSSSRYDVCIWWDVEIIIIRFLPDKAWAWACACPPLNPHCKMQAVVMYVSMSLLAKVCTVAPLFYLGCSSMVPEILGAELVAMLKVLRYPVGVHYPVHLQPLKITERMKRSWSVPFYMEITIVMSWCVWTQRNNCFFFQFNTINSSRLQTNFSRRSSLCCYIVERSQNIPPLIESWIDQIS